MKEKKSILIDNVNKCLEFLLTYSITLEDVAESVQEAFQDKAP